VLRTDPELELYRGLIDQPTTYEEGFDIKAIIGAIFVGFVMMPGAIYLGLVAGQSLGPAAEWTTIILFTEVARRSFVTLKKQEIYILFSIAGALTSMQGGVALAGGAFAGKIWDQYFIRSPAAKGMGIANQIPTWVVPNANSPAILHRTFLHPDWLIPGLLLFLGTILGRINSFTIGYLLFRLTSDYQRLPFPWAAVSAQGATALAEASSKEETWRWRTFSIGAMIGLVFGAFYVGIPTVTGCIMTKPLQLLPIPWVDLTRSTETILPAVPTGFVTSLGSIGGGFVSPFWAVVGGAVAAVLTMIVNPYMHRIGVLTTWKAGMGTIETNFANDIDFYFSFRIGVGFAVFAISMYGILMRVLANRKLKQQGQRQVGSWIPPEGRGDSMKWVWWCIGLFLATTLAYCILCFILVPKFPWWIIVFFGFIFTPINSLIDATMVGMVGQWVGIPMVREATFILSGYKGVDIWFAPIPISDYGGGAQNFRVIELTGTKFTSTIKAELTVWPLTLFCSLLFWQFIWRLAPIPSVYYPFAQKMWHLQALQRGLMLTSTVNRERSLFFRAWKPPLAIAGFVFGTGMYAFLNSMRLPIMFVFGIVRGLGTLPHYVFPELVGALISQYYFVPRYGARRWKQYATVLMAGFSCGMGLIGMGTVALAMISKSVSQMPY
jgi:hypothetical protein